jgi:hypothetical protein
MQAADTPVQDSASRAQLPANLAAGVIAGSTFMVDPANRCTGDIKGENVMHGNGFRILELKD